MQEIGMEYVCMSFGWFQELLREERVPNFAAAEAKLVEMLEAGGMIVHAYRESNPDQPELVGRNRTFRSFMAERRGLSAHEVERYLLDRALLPAWKNAVERDGVIENRWQVVDLAPPQEVEGQPVYGKAMRLMQGAGARALTGTEVDRAPATWERMPGFRE
jgi:hypothetical protein